MPEKRKCDFCRKYPATSQDYRQMDGILSKYRVCEWCFSLDDVTIYKIQRDKLDPKDYYDEEEDDEG